MLIITGTRNWWRLASAKDYWFVSSYRPEIQTLLQKTFSPKIATFAGKLIVNLSSFMLPIFGSWNVFSLTIEDVNYNMLFLTIPLILPLQI